MFKIIKTSTYKDILYDAKIVTLFEKKVALLESIIDFKDKRIKLLETKLHHQTAKKLPIKKSKNK